MYQISVIIVDLRARLEESLSLYRAVIFSVGRVWKHVAMHLLLQFVTVASFWDRMCHRKTNGMSVALRIAVQISELQAQVGTLAEFKSANTSVQTESRCKRVK